MADLMTIRRNIMASNAKKPVPNVYGVEWNYADPSTILKRTGDAINFANPIPAESLNEIGWSPFDNIYPWSEMKCYNIINGEVAYSEDDAGYSETAYDTVVYIPEFYYYADKNTTDQKWNWSISAKPLEGYKKHPGSGKYIGRFHTSGDSSGVFTKSGVAPLVNNSRANFRTYSHNKGNNWWQIDLETWSALQMLYLVEFADWNSEVLGYNVNKGTRNTGMTTGASYHTIKCTKFDSTMYRWVENPFNNVITFIDGVISSYRNIFISANKASYGDSANGMSLTGIDLPATSGYITGLGYSEECPWAFIPDNAYSGSDSTKIPDYVTVYNGTTQPVRCITAGGVYGKYKYYGFFYFGASAEVSLSNSTTGSRLIFGP